MRRLLNDVETYSYDHFGRLAEKSEDGVTAPYAYDAVGRMTREGAKTYRYGYLDKVLSVTEGRERRTFTYHADGQLATATRAGGSRSCAAAETFLWDGLALIRRGSTSYVNEPHANGGSPILSSKDGMMFNDILGTTVGTDGKDGYAATSLTAFGDSAPGGSRSVATDVLFTGKPHVDGLGYAFLFRNYRPGLGKWQTADPFGYPDGWNQLAYCGNEMTSVVDVWGCKKEDIVRFDTLQSFYPSFIVIPWYNSEWDAFGLAQREAAKAQKSVEDWVREKLNEYRKKDGSHIDALMEEFVRYFADLQGSNYNENPPGVNEDPWKTILKTHTDEGWILEYGPRHEGLSLDYDDDITNAGLGALIISGCTHHWVAKFIKE